MEKLYKEADKWKGDMTRIEEIQKQAIKQERIVEKAEILTSLLRAGTIEAIDLDPVVRIECESGQIYSVDRPTGDRRDISFDDAYRIILEHLERLEKS